MQSSTKKLRKQHNNPCIYCKRVVLKPGSPEAIQNPGLEFSEEHYIPRSRGGTNERENLKISCQRCNHLKAATMPEIFDPFARIILTKYPDAPTPVLKDAFKQYVMSLAEIAVRNKVGTKRALLVTLLQVGESLKGR